MERMNEKSEPKNEGSSLKKSIDDCVRPACASIKDMVMKSMKKDDELPASTVKKSCPLNREELGRASWSLLHTTAAWYPETPSESDKLAARHLISSIARLYPCSHCADDFMDNIKECPPKVESREAFAIWMCCQHNLVNKKMHKPLFDCSLAKVDERWREGHPSCFQDQGSPAESFGRE